MGHDNARQYRFPIANSGAEKNEKEMKWYLHVSFGRCGLSSIQKAREHFWCAREPQRQRIEEARKAEKLRGKINIGRSFSRLISRQRLSLPSPRSPHTATHNNPHFWSRFKLVVDVNSDTLRVTKETNGKNGAKFSSNWATLPSCPNFPEVVLSSLQSADSPPSKHSYIYLTLHILPHCSGPNDPLPPLYLETFSL